ncbi:MAG: ClbS/DfsB family four-helix bundle protein [Pseudomonadota bacterium]
MWCLPVRRSWRHFIWDRGALPEGLLRQRTLPRLTGVNARGVGPGFDTFRAGRRCACRRPRPRRSSGGDGAGFCQAQAELGWEAARAWLVERHTALLVFIAGLSEAALYGGVMIGHDKWSVGRFAEASGASHYRSAVKFVRKALRER